MSENSRFEFVVTARPSWSRVKNLVHEYLNLVDPRACSISLVGPALSDRYGKLHEQMPKGIVAKNFFTLQDGDELSTVAKSCLSGASALVQSWELSCPGAVLVVADRTETLGVSTAASIMQIPLVHLQGGETSGSIDDKVRNANSQLADYHLTTNNNTAQRLIRMGRDEEKIAVIGCPSIDIVKERIDLKAKINPYSTDYSGVGDEFSTQEDFGLILFHPDTFDRKSNKIWVESILESIEESTLNWFWFWPNPDYGSSEIAKLIRTKRESRTVNKIKFIVNLDPEKFIDLTLGARILLGNSSYGIREASYVGLPVINLGNRQKNRERSNNVLDINTPKNFMEDWKDHAIKSFERSLIYGEGNAGKLGAQAIRNWFPSIH